MEISELPGGTEDIQTTILALSLGSLGQSSLWGIVYLFIK